MNTSIKPSAMYHRLITISLLWLAVVIRDATCVDRPIVFSRLFPNFPTNTFRAESHDSPSPALRLPTAPPKLLNSYLAPVMQALAYHIELLQYEPLSGTTIEPPFLGGGGQQDTGTSPLPPGTTTSSSWWQKPSTSGPPTTTSTAQPASSTIWWQPPSATTTTTAKPPPTTSAPWWQTSSSSSTSSTASSVPWWQTSSTTSTTTTKFPATEAVTWWPSVPTTTSTTTTTTTTAKPTIAWWQTTTHRPETTTTQKATTSWWQTSTHKPDTTTTVKTSTPWWQSPTQKPDTTTTQRTSTPWWQSPTQKPDTTSTTHRTTASWWQTTSQKPERTTTTTQKPWWQTSSTAKPTTATPWWQTTTTTKQPLAPWFQQTQTTTTKPSSSSWWQTTTTTKQPLAPWFQQTQTTTTKPSSSSWWQTTTVRPTATAAVTWWPSASKPQTTKPPAFTTWWQTTSKPTATKPPTAASWWQTTAKPAATTKPTTGWWQTTAKPAAHKPSSHKPASSIWWLPFSTQSTTQKPWWEHRPADHTTKPPANWWSTSKPTAGWWSSNNPTTAWWQHSTTQRPDNHWVTSTQKPWWATSTTTTAKPWWLENTTKPPATVFPWGSLSWSTNKKPFSKPTLHTTDDAAVVETTPFHMPGNFAPPDPYLFYSSLNEVDSDAHQANEVYSAGQDVSSSTTTKRIVSTSTRKDPNWPFDNPPLAADANFIDWLLQGKLKPAANDLEYDFSLLDPLPGSLIRDLLNEKYELPALRDIDNVNEFLRVYDDSYGRYRPISGKKRIPPTKPYVEFLMLYDLLKREAKTLNLTTYEGYSEEFIHDLAATSKRSAEVQLHILLTRMLEQNEVTRTDVTTRIKGIIKDLENPKSTTAMALHVIPPLQFMP